MNWMDRQIATQWSSGNRLDSRPGRSGRRGPCRSNGSGCRGNHDPALGGSFWVALPVAVATDLLFATITKSVGAVFHHRIGTIDWSVARALWTGSIPGTIVGVSFVLFFAEKSQTQWLTWPLAALVLMTEFILGRRALGLERARAEHRPPRPVNPVVPVAGGFGIGTAVALTSVGAGALGMALLVRLIPGGDKTQQLVGTDIVHSIPIALVAGIAYGSFGFVSWPLLWTLLIGSLPGVVLGTLLSGRAPTRILQGALSLVLVSVVILLVTA
jgi:uncharacterized membrane protein YfcA